jgi:hypothetical protein
LVPPTLPQLVNPDAITIVVFRLKTLKKQVETLADED